MPTKGHSIMKIIVAGAGCGGLQAAKLLAAKGHEVTIYEKNTEEEVGFDWRDEIDYKLFADSDIKLPKRSYRADITHFVPTFSDNGIPIDIPKENRDWVVERRVLVKEMIADALAKGAKINYGMTVKKLILKGEKVSGVLIGGEKIYCDIVIDACGINSPLRKSFPEEFGITKEPGENDYYSAFRGVFDFYPERLPSKQRKKIYIKFMGQGGISKCICHPDEYADIFVSKLGRMSRFEFETMMRQLRIENQIIGYEMYFGGKFIKIPSRYPLCKMVAEGYAAIGDSAFMANPITCQGVADSIKAGNLLAAAINEGGSASVRSLWKYQTDFFKQIGWEYFAADITKRFILSCKSEEIRFLLEGGLFTKDELKMIAQGKGIILSTSSIIDKLKRGRKKFKFVLALVTFLNKGKKATSLAKSIPAKYDKGKIDSWQKSIEKLYE